MARSDFFIKPARAVIARPDVETFHPTNVVLRPVTGPTDVTVEMKYRPVIVGPPPLPTTPLLDAAQESQLKQNPIPATDLLVAGTKFRPLSTWLADPASAIVQCTKSVLRISLSAADGGANLMPLAGGQITAATLVNLPNFAAVPPLQLKLDEQQRRLNLSLQFPANNAQALYEALIKAMMDPASKVGINLSYTHLYAVMTTAAAIGPVMRPVDPSVLVRPVVVERPDPGVVLHPYPYPYPQPPPQPVTPHRQERFLALNFTFPICRTQDTKPDPYPDWPKPPTVRIWDSYPIDPDNSNRQVFFKASSTPDCFYYLPTMYKLGFYVDEQGSLQLPIVAQNYLAGKDDYRVKVKLIALPFIEDAVRENLREHIRTKVLNNQLPYVGVIPAAGVSCKFGSDFTPVSQSSTGAGSLPATIQFTAGSLAAEQRLAFDFDMAAFDYSLFGEILRHGIVGTLFFDDGTDLHYGVPVSMRLDDIIANSLEFQVNTDATGNTRSISLGNILDFPVQIGQARVFFLKRGEVFPEMVFDAEGVIFLTSGHEFPPKNDPQAAVDFPLKPTRTDWNHASVALGTIHANAGTADDWLNRVNRDPSLQPQQFVIHVDLIIPDSAKQVLGAVQLKIYLDGEAAPRKDRQVVPSAPAWDLPVDMTLAELMGTGGQRATFSLEYYSIYQDGSLGLAQRVELDPSGSELPLMVLRETAATRYTVVYDDESGEHQMRGDRAAVEATIANLRQAGRRWKLFAQEPQAPPAPTGTPDAPTTPVTPAGGGAGTTTPPATGTQPAAGTITIVTDLLGDRFANGKLKQVFAELQPVTDGAASTSFSFDASHHDAQAWRPANPSVPPFKYRITFLYEGSVVRQTEGTERGSILILDPPAIS
jgi:hypothetical protein